LHPEVSNAVSDHIHATWVEPEGNHQNSDNEYSTKVMGKFACSNDECPTRRWSSKTVAILIRGYPGNGYNAAIFNQRCKSCNELGDFTLDENSYVERVAYRLKKWAGVQMERQHYDNKLEWLCSQESGIHGLEKMA
ncbi:zinc-binding domain-containing protein, partial [Coniochaeta sp. 2T2.1]